MNKTLLIFRHEFLHTIKRKGFIIMTLIVPVLALLAIGVFQLISAIIEPPEVETTTIGYVDEIGIFDQYTSQGPIELVRYATQDEATAALLKDDVSEYFVISTSYTSIGLVNRYTLEKQLEPPQEFRPPSRDSLRVISYQGKCLRILSSSLNPRYI